MYLAVSFGRRKNPYDGLTFDQLQRTMEDLETSYKKIPIHSNTLARIADLEKKMSLVSTAKEKRRCVKTNPLENGLPLNATVSHFKG